MMFYIYIYYIKRSADGSRTEELVAETSTHDEQEAEAIAAYYEQGKFMAVIDGFMCGSWV